MSSTHILTQPQLDCLTSPIRLAIIQRLEIDKQATAREIAQRMGRPVTSLYHHLKQMEEIGLLRVVGERRGARRPEAVYAMVADHLSSSSAVGTEEGRRTYARAALRVAEAGARAVSAAIEGGTPRFEGDQRTLAARFHVVRANAAKLARINRALNALEEALYQDCEVGEEILLTVLLAPQG
ncbi:MULTISPECIES: winged helix-turn-helix domain-containing protein [Nitrospirillum]|uniref:Helix-turn-helix protein n=1 Tax=Nitrospirillum amazonense TaxID=28077 RepID=A0A560G6Z6_9PROT|nr:helix-turn-helix domain-containing protein [Nitrospirillum amazonense]MEC4593147.1 helix-turn-helix domain-containing protein [Nitrospirillum amazonense]TWB29597.1 helix-turn-helix protein [Nitrospirillum amazonense]